MFCNIHKSHHALLNNPNTEITFTDGCKNYTRFISKVLYVVQLHNKTHKHNIILLFQKGICVKLTK